MPIPLADRGRFRRRTDSSRRIVEMDFADIERRVLHAIQTKIDEEGCGAVFAALNYGPTGEGIQHLVRFPLGRYLTTGRIPIPPEHQRFP